MRTAVHRVVASLVVVAAAASTAGCALRFQGELGGDPLPPFSTGAFTLFDQGAGRLSVGALALPGDSCQDGADLFRINRRQQEATTQERFEETAEELADWFGANLPRNSWMISVNLFTDGGAFLDGASVDFDDTDTDVRAQLVACRSDSDDPKARDGFFSPDMDCFIASDGEVDITFDDTTLGLRSTEAIEFREPNGQIDGELLFEMAFTSCPAMDDDFALLQGGGGGRPPIGEGEGEGEGECFEECFEDENGQVQCEVFCR
jgi:hypothetical protein